MSQATFPDPLGRSGAEITLGITFAILVCLAAIIGNVLVVYVVNKYSEMQTITNIFIQNLALTDIATATLNMPFWTGSLYIGRWNFSQGWCEVSASIILVTAIASVLSMGLIALNRYIKVVKRALYIKFFPSKRVAWVYCGVVWLVSVLFATPTLYGWGKIDFDSDLLLCFFKWKEGHFSLVVMSAGFFNGMASTISYSYWRIYQTVKESTNNINANVAQNGVGTPRFNRADIKLLKTCFTVVRFFFTTWGLPSIITSLATYGVSAPRVALKIAPYFTFSGSLVNPIIYGIMNPQFKKAFKKALGYWCYGNHDLDQNHARAGAAVIHTL